MTGTMSRNSSNRNSRNGVARNVRNHWRGILFVLGVLSASIGVGLAAIFGAYEWQMLTVFAAGLTAQLFPIAVRRSTLALQYRVPRFVLSLYATAATLVGMAWAGALANTSDVLNVLQVGVVVSILAFVSLALPAAKKPGRVFTITTVRSAASPWSV